MKNLKLVTLLAAGLLTITACGAKAVSFADWKKKADACKDKEYATATLKVKSNSKDQEGSETKEDATYHYTLKDGAWTNDEKDGVSYVYYVGLKAKEVFTSEPTEISGSKYTFYSDLSVKMDVDSKIAVLGYEVATKGTTTIKFNGNGYLTGYSSKSESTYTANGESKKATSNGTLSISYK